MRFIVLTIVTLGLLLTESQLASSSLFKKCDSSHGTISSVSVTNCKDTDSYCILKKNQNMGLTLDFVPNFSASTANVHLYGVLGHVKIPFKINPENACGNYGLSCPLQVGKPAKLSIQVPIKAIYPNLQLEIILEVVDETSAKLACLSFIGKIKS